jgi:nucleoside-diphosphate-sugar epimerase
MHVLVTGATGKVGRAFLTRFLADARWSDARVRALCHNRTLPPEERLEVVRGSIADREVVERAMAGITHVFHMATVKEDPVQAMDVSVKGMFFLLEAFRASATAQQFVLIGGDCAVGHIFQRYDAPITEASPRRPYPGVYALSKVLEEAMLESYFVQYGLNGTILRAPWIMEKDDFRYVLSFAEDQFGGPPWETLISPAERRMYAQNRNLPVLIDAAGQPLRRNFVHVTDLAEAMVAVIDNEAARQQLFNIAMTRAIDYAEVAAYLEETRGLKGVRINSPYHSNILDNAKARLLLGWEPAYDIRKLIDEAFDYERAENDVRKVWYAG